MSHSKKLKRGKSFYIENWNPSAKRFVNTCALCGAQGYDPGIDEEGFVYDASMKMVHFEHRAIRDELKSVLEPLPVDDLGRCAVCAKLMDKQSMK